MPEQGTQSERDAIQTAPAGRGYPSGFLDRYEAAEPPRRVDFLSEIDSHHTDQNGTAQSIADDPAQAQAVERQLIPSRYPAAIREIIVGQPIAHPTHVEDEHPAPSENVTTQVASRSFDAQALVAANFRLARTGTIAVIADEIREVTGALAEGLGLFARLPLFIARGMKRSLQNQFDVIADPMNTIAQTLDLEAAARTLETGFDERSIGIARSINPEQDSFLPESLRTETLPAPTHGDDPASAEAFLPAELRTNGYREEPRADDAKTEAYLPAVYMDAGSAQSEPDRYPSIDFLNAPAVDTGPSRGREICVATVIALFKTCKMAGRVAKFSAVDAPRFVLGVVREASEATRPAEVLAVVEDADPELIVEVQEDIAPILVIEAEIEPVEAATDQVDFEHEVEALAPEVIDAVEDEIVPAEVAETTESVVAVAEVEGMIQAAIEAYADKLKQSAQDVAADEVSPTTDSLNEQVVEQDLEQEQEVEAEIAAVQDAPIEDEKIAVEPRAYAPRRAATPWPLAADSAPYLEDDEDENVSWASGIFYAGLGTLLATTLSASLLFTIGFVINLFAQGYFALLGVLLMVAGIGGVMIAVMLLNEWLSVLRFQLSSAVRLMVRCTGVLAASVLLLAFVATTIPREHWPI